jgi:uncharacterized protein involved in exopolysaccharide biosynthesis
METTREGSTRYLDLVWRALRRRRWLATGIFLAVAAVVGTAVARMEPRYESVGTVWIEEKNLGLFPDFGQRGRVPVLLVILASRNLAASVVDVLPRRAFDELLQKRLGSSTEGSRRRKDGQGKTQADWTTAIANWIPGYRGKLKEAPSPREMVISELKGRMKFTPQRTSTGIVTVTATASNPIVAADIATAYVETLQNRTRFFTQEESVAVREFLEKQARQVGATLQAAEDALAQFERQRGFVRIDERLRASLDTLNQAEAALAGANLSEDIARTRLAAIKAQIEGRPAGRKITDTLIVPPALRTLFDRWQAAETRMATLSRRYTEAHPQVKAAKEEAQELWPRLSEGLRQHLEITVSPSLPPAERVSLIDQAMTLGEEIVRIQEGRELYESKVRNQKATLGALSQDQTELARRRQAVDAAKNLHDAITKRAKEANIRVQEELRNVRVLDPPSVPTSTSSALLVNTLLVGLAVALCLSIGVPVGLELLDVTLKTEEEAEAILPWPVLGTIPAMHARVALADGGRVRALPQGPLSGGGREP